MCHRKKNAKKKKKVQKAPQGDRSRTPARDLNKQEPIGDPKPNPAREVID